MNMLKQMNQSLSALWLRLLSPREFHYINGTDVLPAPLDAQQEQQALTDLAAGKTAARDLLITHNLRLVVYIAKKFETPSAGIEDMISIGTIGLIKAVNTFEPSKNIKLATYASRCIENEILMYLRKSSNRRQDASIDEPLNTDNDGNELLLMDVLTSDQPQVGKSWSAAQNAPLCGWPLNGWHRGNGALWNCVLGSTMSLNIRKKKWPIHWGFPKVTFLVWKNASSNGFAVS